MKYNSKEQQKSLNFLLISLHAIKATFNASWEILISKRGLSLFLFNFFPPD